VERENANHRWSGHDGVPPPIKNGAMGVLDWLGSIPHESMTERRRTGRSCFGSGCPELDHLAVLGADAVLSDEQVPQLPHVQGKQGERRQQDGLWSPLR
jgi:hypothetical protein